MYSYLAQHFLFSFPALAHHRGLQKPQESVGHTQYSVELHKVLKIKEQTNVCVICLPVPLWQSLGYR